MKKIHIPQSVVSISVDAFFCCDELERITVDEYNMVYDSRQQCNAIIHSETNKILRGCKTTDIVESIESIGESAFSGIGNLKYVCVPDNIKTIEKNAFYFCPELEEVCISKCVTNLADDIFGDDVNPISENFVIKSTTDAYSHTYAIENNIPWCEIKEQEVNEKNSVTNEQDANMKIKGEMSVLPMGTTFTREWLIEGEQLHQMGENVSVTMDIPESIKLTNDSVLAVYRLENDGTLTRCAATMNNGKVTFITDHFSTYILIENEVVLGDVNGDGIINIKDSALLRRYVAGWNVEQNVVAADVDGDGIINIKDSALIRRYVAGWSVEFR